VGLIFRREHVELICRGLKTQTRRRHRYRLKAGKIYDVKLNWVKKTGLKILITRVYTQRLGDMSEEEALKEGGYTLEEFKKVWERINGSWNPDEVVVVYEFRLIDSLKPKR